MFISFIFGVASWVLCFMGNLSIIAIPLSMVGLVLAIKAKQNEIVPGSSILGLVLNLTALLYSALIVVVAILNAAGLGMNIQPIDLREYIKYFLHISK